MKPTTTLLLVALATSLGGCKSFLQAFDFSRHSSAPAYAIGPADLDEGREHLRAGRVGNALAPLHRAALNPATSGDALNALGVAYSKLGRADLAERYFLAAVELDADNERYAANLARFYDSDLARDTRLLYAQRERAQAAYTEFAASEAAVTPEPQALERTVLSGGETHRITVERPVPSVRVQVATSQPTTTTAPRIRVAGGSIKTPATARPAEIRIGDRQGGYPVRVRIGSAAQAKTAAYPLRVSLPGRHAPARD